MDDKTFLCRLKIPLIEKDYGNTAAEVLRTCALVAEYVQEHTPEQVKAFQEEVGINPQVWSRLIALHKDSRLKKHLEHLPSSYTALYAISRMQDEEVDASIQQGVIHPSASSHSILKWTKENRLISSEMVPPYQCLITFKRQLSQEEFKQLTGRINAVAGDFAACLVPASSFESDVSTTQKKKSGLIEDVGNLLGELLEPFLPMLLEQDRTKMGVANLGDLVHVGIPEFKKLLKSVRARQHETEHRGKYGKEYALKLALEFLKTDSRSQRFNYKRRLKELGENQPELQEFIDQVISDYMSEKKMVVARVNRIGASSQVPDIFSPKDLLPQIQ